MKKILALVVLLWGGVGWGQTEPAGGPATTRAGEGIVLTSPREWEVFQRSSQAYGVVRIAGRLKQISAEKLNVQVTLGEGPGPSAALQNSINIAADGTFSGEITLPALGWNSIQLQAVTGQTIAARTDVNHVGVGEVFVVGGQSNSTNYGEVKTKSETGMVTVFDGKEWTLAADPLPGVDGKGGSPWCIFGDLMAKRLGVPIGIVPVGKGSTSVRQWLPKGDVVEIEPSRTYGLKKNAEGKWVSEGLLYDRMVERMKQLGAAPPQHGFRAMLWHQGESDAHQSGGHTLPGKDYRVMLERVIGESRKAVGWGVPWFVAEVSWGTPESPADPDIRAAQKAIWDDGVALPGPDTDTLIGEFRQKKGTGVHMSEKGLHAHAALWADIVGKWVESEMRNPKSEIGKPK